jgi:hypothetical protein
MFNFLFFSKTVLSKKMFKYLKTVQSKIYSNFEKITDF